MSSVELLKPIILGLLFSSVDIAEKRKKATRHVAVANETYERWKKSFPWLEVFRPNQNETTRLKCSVCRELKKSNVMALDGSHNIQYSTVKKHNDSTEHKDSKKKMLQNKMIEEADPEPCSESICHTDDEVLFRTVYCVAKEELPSEKVNPILQLQALNGVSIKYKNLSWDTVSEIQGCMSEIIARSLVDEINSSPVFSLMLDENTDITVEKRLPICICYVKLGSPVTRFLSNIKLDNGKAHTSGRLINRVGRSLLT